MSVFHEGMSKAEVRALLGDPTEMYHVRNKQTRNPGGFHAAVDEDLSGFTLDADKRNHWCKLILPYEYDPNTAPKYRNKLGCKDPRTKDGELPIGDSLSLLRRTLVRVALQL
jgi:hypothetical protein